MGYIQKIPFILGTLMAIITGIVSFEYGIEPQEIYIKMAISMIVFFTIGVFIRSTIQKTADEYNEKIRKMQEEEEKKKAEEENINKKDNEKKENQDLKNPKPSAVNYSVNDKMDDFEPLKISEVIRSEIKK
ncbi:hypothetical protein CDQ84_05335 [Clostridium thermosuccinogenes]|jgi:hypothetical protein|uniref:Uncharacterized protein n=1 Tax=Clostridium thermosuccinogenes TaxID=84032 RepID=A0A2K2FPH2_9CLOT|nr:hypothetical protein [Pseudoclostridium thermosuccinogenes]AUS96352.1 hypothetical protein CDO33_07835 [Pseudoclostridium thermosuccinogenes]PNT98566.1 hypothetical protein CDQ85_05240 [Pseudoclostridium thermosuccinogenes]PNU00668.1 hypothetical protein CDQ84_05335 [Pseudoclostridium thermosuccinogenes]